MDIFYGKWHSRIKDATNISMACIHKYTHTPNPFKWTICGHEKNFIYNIFFFFFDLILFYLESYGPFLHINHDFVIEDDARGEFTIESKHSSEPSNAFNENKSYFNDRN